MCILPAMPALGKRGWFDNNILQPKTINALTLRMNQNLLQSSNIDHPVIIQPWTSNAECWNTLNLSQLLTITVYVNTDPQPSSRLILYSSTLSPQPSSTSNIDPQPLLNKPWKTELYTGKVTTHYTVHSMIWSGQAWHNIKTHLRFVFEIWKRPVDFL